MRILKDKRLKEFIRIEHLLYGINYEVWLNLYGPTKPDISLGEALLQVISKDCELSDVFPASPEEAVADIMKMVLHNGDTCSGPIELDSKREEISVLMNKVFSMINIRDAEILTGFGLKQGHPFYPVFWDFAYDIHSNGQRWILLGSSSD